MYFKNQEHQEFYNKKIGQTERIDNYIKSLIYLLASNKETRAHFEEIYNIKENEINIESLQSAWQTNSSINTCRLAFNLFGDISSDEIEERASNFYTVSGIFKNLEIEQCIEALNLRFCKNV